MLSVIENFPESRDELIGIISSLLAQNAELKAQADRLSANNHRQETQNEQLVQRLHWLEEQFYLLRHKRFGVSSEHLKALQGNLFNEAEVVSEQEPAQ